MKSSLTPLCGHQAQPLFSSPGAQQGTSTPGQNGIQEEDQAVLNLLSFANG
jgi:hypothetical protein